ncbi:hypothetical protein C2S51_032696 [Perilla frutescens var. frutescens]|nr:hypothetical protein C2S51_032696 [Perilla frutescens var. frutescens]
MAVPPLFLLSLPRRSPPCCFLEPLKITAAPAHSPSTPQHLGCAPARHRLSHLPSSAPSLSSVSDEISTILEMTMLEMSCCSFDGFSPHNRREGRRGERWEVGGGVFLVGHGGRLQKTRTDPKQLLSGNLSPADELPPTACEEVEGSLPPCLDGGAYIQNGPNPHFYPRGPYIFPDGDGMLHSIKIFGGKPVFCSRFIQTFKYTTERDLGQPIFPNIVAFFCSNLTPSMALTLARLLLAKINPFVDGLGTANTSLALIGGRLHALTETDLPYQVKITPDGEITTVGRHDFFQPRSRHRRNLRLQILRRPSILDLLQNQFRWDEATGCAHFLSQGPFEILRGRPMLRVDADKVSRVGVIPRYAEDEREMFWIDEPGLNVLHVVNAWEEDDGDKIMIVASNILSVEHVLEQINLIHLSLEKIVIDAKTKKVVMRRPLSDSSLDFGVINPQYAQRKNRYVYAAVIESMPKMVGVVKMDLSLSAVDCTVASRMYGPGCYRSEPIFVAREEAEEEEDDGYLVAYVSNENTQESQFIVMDAKSATLEIVAAVKLPHRVPQGFHSIFVKESELKKL